MILNFSVIPLWLVLPLDCGLLHRLAGAPFSCILASVEFQHMVIFLPMVLFFNSSLPPIVFFLVVVFIFNQCYTYVLESQVSSTRSVSLLASNSLWMLPGRLATITTFSQ